MQTHEPNTPPQDSPSANDHQQGEQLSQQPAGQQSWGGEPDGTVEGSASYPQQLSYLGQQSYPPAYPTEGEPNAPTTPASAPYGSYTPYSPYGSYGSYGPYGPSQGGGWSPSPAGQPGGVRTARPLARRPWLYAVIAMIVLALLVVGLVAALGRTNAPSTGKSPSTVGGAAPTVVVPPSAQDLQQTIINVIQTTQPSVVEVTSEGAGGGAIGSGVVLRADGYIVTNDHVVTGFSSFSVTLSSGKQETATLVGEDPQDDLAVLKVNESNLRPINFADSSKVRIGQFAIAIGNPLGLTQSATFGIISALNRTASEGQQGPASLLTGLIQTSAPINPGNSGGALVDLQGQLMGIPTLGVQDQQTGGTAAGIGFAIPSDRVKFVAQQLIQSGHLTSTGQGFLGIRGEDVTPDLASANNLPVQSGVLVTGFVNDAAGQSPAQKAGLRVGDIITAVNGQAINSNADLASALISQSPGTQVTLTVARGSGQQTVTVTLGERPTNLQG